MGKKLVMRRRRKEEREEEYKRNSERERESEGEKMRERASVNYQRFTGRLAKLTFTHLFFLFLQLYVSSVSG